MRVLVTGATGFLGGWVCRALLRRRHQVRVLVRPSSRLDNLTGLRLERREGDVLDRRSIAAAAEGVRAVVHAAGLISTRPRDRERLYQVNVEGTRHVLEVAAERGLRVIHTSSIATVGFTDGPTARDEGLHAAPGELVDYPYADSKRQGEALAVDFARRGLDLVTLLPGMLLGPGDSQTGSTRVVLHYLRRLLRFSPTGGISFGDVRDVAEVYAAALAAAPRRSGQRYILAGQNRSYRELGQALAALTGLDNPWQLPTPLAQLWGLWSEAAAMLVPHPLEELTVVTATYAARFNYCDASRATRELGYRPRPFETTLRDTIVDLLGRGLAEASTDRLRALMRAAASAAGATSTR